MADSLEQLQLKLAAAQSRSGTGNEYIQKANRNLISSLQQQISDLTPSSSSSGGTNYYTPGVGGVGYAPDPVQNPQVYSGVSSSAITPPTTTTTSASGGSSGGTSTYTPPSNAINENVVPANVNNLNQQPAGAFDYNAMADAFTKSFAKNFPQLSQVNPYQSQYNNDIMGTLSQLKNMQSFNYDVNNDAALKQAQKQAGEVVMKDAAKRGRVFDTYTDKQLQEVSQGLVPQYYQIAQNQYNTDRNNQYNLLSAINNLDSTAYNRYIQNAQLNRDLELNNQNNYVKSIDYGNTMSNQQFNRDVTSSGLTGQFQNKTTTAEQQRQYENQNTTEDRLRLQTLQDVGVVLTPAQNQLRTTYTNMTPQIRTQVLQLSNNGSDFASAINNPNTPKELIPYLQAARFNKVLSNPETYKDYLVNEYGLSPVQVNNLVVGNKIKALELAKTEASNKVEQVKALYAGQKEKAELDKVLAQIKAENSKAAQEILKEINLPEKLKAELNQEIAKVDLVKAQTGAQNANASADKARAGVYAEQVNTEKSQQKKYNSDADKTSNETNSSFAAGVYNLYLNSGKKNIDEFLKSKGKIQIESNGNKKFIEDPNGTTMGSTLTDKDLKMLKDLEKNANPFN